MKHTTITRRNTLSKNTAKVAQAISLLSDVLSSEVECELNEDTETEDTDEYDELKDQAVMYGEIVDSDLSVISHDLERVLDLAEDIDGDSIGNDNYSWNVGNSTFTAGDDDESNEETADNDTDTTEDTEDEAEAEPTADEKLDLLAAAGAILEEKNVELEKNNGELTDKIEDLTDTIRGASALIDSLSALTDTFVSEVKSL